MYMTLYLVGIALLHHHNDIWSKSHSFQSHHEYSPQALPQFHDTVSRPGGLDQYHGQSKHCSKLQHLVHELTEQLMHN